MKAKIVLLIGAFLVSLRLIFPVLQCTNLNDLRSCYYGQVAFFALKPDIKYHYHIQRTNTQAIAIAVFTLALFYILKDQHSQKDYHTPKASKEKSKKK